MQGLLEVHERVDAQEPEAADGEWGMMDSVLPLLEVDDAPFGLVNAQGGVIVAPYGGVFNLAPVDTLIASVRSAAGHCCLVCLLHSEQNLEKYPFN